MIILAIDTSCDETSVAVTRGTHVCSNMVSSQVRFHRQYGGVVPFLAQQLHKKKIDHVVAAALKGAQCGIADVGAIAVTMGPGLAPALQVGIEKAKQLAFEHGLPIYPINHMYGHIASCLIDIAQPEYPLLAVLVSGGHTEIVVVEKFGQAEIVGETLDDALGEAYDKVAKLLGLGYPGGGVLATVADRGDALSFPLPIPMQRDSSGNLSYSGLKTAVRQLVEEMSSQAPLSVLDISNIAASFQRVAQQSLLKKVELAMEKRPEVKTLVLAGGVAANRQLRAHMRTVSRKYRVPLLVPKTKKLCGDNAAMIGVAAHLAMQAGFKSIPPEQIDRRPGWRIDQVV
jgi:N6-L-threonylcarbamoyladenine synthase